ncbi:catechol 2,3-dioxygenase [Virgibacillus natechei]|uniref:Catechol 2,3-dioxygenase n=1 Tax=Virgibacillus natechei TaxID=1216297 RepID=A0ABS4IBZ9_9BACI|nr:VOC family protein [Virgibacillus natechei]MBP1968378.1 catechol 2,3-dioxygenase [Virgibacillus natechei]UZD13507.1 VOC family protein [Virgibacillus natechei]
MENKFFEKPATYVGELSVNVTDLEKALTFYQDVIGFQILEQSERKASLTADGKTALLTLEQPENVQPKEGRTTGLFHFAILLPTRVDLSSFVNYLIKKGDVRLGASDHYVSEALYLSDPDGNGIEVYRDRPSSEWSWTNGEVSMGTEALDGDSLVAESNKEWNGLPSETIMGHIHLHVSDLQTTDKFYMDGLGFTVVTKYSGALFTSTADYHHHIGLNVWNGEGAPTPAKNSVGLNWYTLVFPSTNVRQEAIDRLEQMGASVRAEEEYYAVEDPSGNVIHLVVH